MTSILGLDISSFQINACLLRDDHPPILRTEIIGKLGKDALVDRVRRIPEAIKWITNELPSDWLVVEEPFGGRNMPKALLMVAGAIIASTPANVRPWLITPMDWRAAIGARNNKPAGHTAIFEECNALGWNIEADGPRTHDELDAIGIALGARKILEGQV